MDINTTLHLAGGHEMPIFGLGTWMATDKAEVRRSVESALDAGYKLIDTARLYTNEDVIGDVLKERIAAGKMKREDVFVTTKLAMIYMGSEELVQKGVERSLKELQLDYVDLFLIHFPVAFKFCGEEVFFPPAGNGKVHCIDTDLISIWKQLETFVDSGKIKALGVSNFNIKQMERIRAVARIPISNNQVELNPYMMQDALVDYCQKHNITVTAYAPIGSPGFAKGNPKPRLLDDPVLHEIAQRLHKTPAQVSLRCIMQKGIAIIPKSVTPSRIIENSQIFDFELSAEDMEKIRKLERNQRYYVMEMTDHHPEYPHTDMKK